jgi:formylglycine-generating enzyme required for sulfatase activity
MWRSAPTDASARVDGHCTHRAYRGGSWLSHPPKYLQIPDRYKYLEAREIDLGFRIALTLYP